MTADPEPETWHELAKWCRTNDGGRLQPHDRQFVRDMAARLTLSGKPTEKQADWLRGFCAKLREPGRG